MPEGPNKEKNKGRASDFFNIVKPGGAGDGSVPVPGAGAGSTRAPAADSGLPPRRSAPTPPPSRPIPPPGASDEIELADLVDSTVGLSKEASGLPERTERNPALDMEPPPPQPPKPAGPPLVKPGAPPGKAPLGSRQPAATHPPRPATTRPPAAPAATRPPQSKAWAPMPEKAPAGTRPAQSKAWAPMPEKAPAPPPPAPPPTPARAPAPRKEITPQQVSDDKYDKMRARVIEAPTDADIRIRFASLCADAGRKDEALEHFQAAARMAPNNGFVRQRIKDLGGVEAAAQAELATNRGPYSSAIKDFLAYPLQGSGAAMIGMGGIMFGLLGLMPFMPWLLRLFLLAYLAAYQFKAIQQSAQGAREPPDWPDAGEAVGALGMQLGANIAAYLPAVVLILGGIYAAGVGGLGMMEDVAMGPPPEVGTYDGSPVLAAKPDAKTTRLILEYERALMADGMTGEEARKTALQEFGGGTLAAPDEPPGGYPSEARPKPSRSGYPGSRGGGGFGIIATLILILGGLAALAGAAYLPMALLITSIFNSSRPSFNYAFGLESIGKILPSYLLCAGFYVGGTVVMFIVGGVLAWFVQLTIPVPILSDIVGALFGTAFSLYTTLALSHLIGRLYFHESRKLDWLPG